MQDGDSPIVSPATPAWPRTRTAREIAARRRTIFVLLVLGILGLIALAGATLYLLWHMEPAYWQKNQAFLQSHDEATLNQMADDMERRILTGLSDPIPPAMTGNWPQPTLADPRVRTVHLSLDEINAWLAADLNAWAANQDISLPAQLSQYMISTEGDRLILACKVDMPSVTQVMSMIVSLRVQEDDKARVRVEGFRAGCLPLPARFIAGRLRNNPEWVERPEVQHILAAIQGRIFDPVIRLDSTHRVRLMALKLDPGGMDITVRDEIRRRRSATIRSR